MNIGDDALACAMQDRSYVIMLFRVEGSPKLEITGLINKDIFFPVPDPNNILKTNYGMNSTV